MHINRKNALKVWESMFGDNEYAEDFHGNYMCKYGYGDSNYYVFYNGVKVYCGWNLHHILPKACGGTNKISNLICTNIVTNELAEDKTTFKIDDCIYQVKKIYGFNQHEIERIY